MAPICHGMTRIIKASGGDQHTLSCVLSLNALVRCVAVRVLACRTHPEQSESLNSMKRTRCTDRVVGSILASWRYDISGIYPEMRKDYEQHLAECSHCSARQKFHRSLDATLAVLTSLSAFFFLFAFLVLKHIKPLEHVAFNVLGLDIARHLSHAGICGGGRRLFLGDCLCPGFDDDAGPVLPWRHRGRASQAD